MSVPFQKNERLENDRLKGQYIKALVTLTGNSTLANITGSTDLPGGVYVYWEGATQPTPVDSGATFGTLDSEAAPAVVGILAMPGDAKRVRFVRVSVDSSASMTAGVPSLKGSSSSGVTASKNIAFTVSCTGLDLDANTNTHRFWVEVWYETE